MLAVHVLVLLDMAHQVRFATVSTDTSMPPPRLTRLLCRVAM
jgi:hypothetical protein